MDPSIYYLLWSIQNALLNAVTPELRAVIVDTDDKNKKALIYFFYDGEITERVREIANLARTETDSYPNHFNEEYILRVDAPKQIPLWGKFAYLRKEPNLPNYPKENRAFLLKTPETLHSSVLLLDMQEALLGKVSPSLRIVTVDSDPKKKYLELRFVYDGAISDEDFSLATVAIQEASAPFVGYEVRSNIERIDFPKSISAKGRRAAYLRREYEYT